MTAAQPPVAEVCEPIPLSSSQAEQYELLCARLLARKASEGEAIKAIRDLCHDNERLALIGIKRGAALTATTDEATRLRAEAERECEALREAIEGLGAMPEGYCFCSENRIGDDSKIHEPECRDLRAALKGLEK